MINYNSLSDEALSALASSGDREAEEKLVRKYNRLVRACARPLFLAGGDSEDLIQEGMMGLISAIKQYNPAKGASFKTYAELCIRRRLYTAIKSAARYKHTPLNDYVSFESSYLDENQPLQLYSLRDPEDFVIAREQADEITEGLEKCLSSFESKVLKHYLEGLSYEEIGKKVNKSVKSVDNAVQRIRKKLARYL